MCAEYPQASFVLGIAPESMLAALVGMGSGSDIERVAEEQDR